ncbi:MAG: Txe/YoeB family addiction module toxin [Prevotellaceae bacterium]|jgi:toxin YoeB|nr:Txe/YoeB family addiction module toxin [Prevotellaceae bacterium]
MYRIVLTKQAVKDYSYWTSSGNEIVIKKIAELLADIAAHPFSGIGKPELLKYDLSGKWSRRINAKHRIVYSANDEVIEVYVFSIRFHYSKNS